MDAVARRMGQSMVVAMGISQEFDDQLRWCTPDRTMIWRPEQVVGEGDAEQ
jgi:hypothetical protein